MVLYKEILINVLNEGKIEVSFSNLEIDTSKIVEMQCYKTLCEIRDIIRDDSLNDKQCFEKIEKIVCAFEQIGSNGGVRHDF